MKHSTIFSFLFNLKVRQSLFTKKLFWILQNSQVTSVYRYKLFSICFVSSLNEGQQLKRSVSAVITAYLNRTHSRRKRREPQTPPCPCSQEQGAVCDLPAPSCQPVAITQLTERQCDKNKRPFYQATLVQFSSVP